MKIRFSVYDVFTDRPFGGNQLAICLGCEHLDETLFQRIAREFNFSETVFILPPRNKGQKAGQAGGQRTSQSTRQSARQKARLRIFTPVREILFAGHPVIGAAVALSDMGKEPEIDMELELGIGPLRVRVGGGRAHFITQAALTEIARPDAGLTARALGLKMTDLDLREHAPVMASLGLPFTITALKSRRALSDCMPDIAAMREGAQSYPSSIDFAQFAYWIDPDNSGKIHARMFAPLDNIPEDPATGSASAALAALLYRLRGHAQAFTVYQGEDMGRPSVINLKASAEGTELAGGAVKTMEGWLTV